MLKVKKNNILNHSMKCYKIAFVFWALSLSSFSQKNYILSDSILYTGINIVEEWGIKNTFYLIEKKQNGELQKYSPYEIKEFGYADGRIFRSKSIINGSKNENFFMELVVQGDYNLYCLYQNSNNRYFLEQNSVKNILFCELTKDNYRDKLLEISQSYKNINEIIQTVEYNLGSISEFLSRLNKGKVYELSKYKWGVRASFEFSKFVNSDQMSLVGIANMNFLFLNSFSIGLFNEIPIEYSSFSIKTEIYFSRYSFIYHAMNVNINNKTTDYDLLGDYSSIKFPVQLKYLLTKRAYSPYISLGPIAGYNFKKKSTLYAALISDNRVEILEPTQPNILNDWLIGYTIGFGFGHQLFGKFKPSFELRYNKLEAIYSGGDHLNNREICLIVGLTF
ncbi:MAG: hypothetical protein ACOYOT_06090 [Bacteroidales bacterium]